MNMPEQKSPTPRLRFPEFRDAGPWEVKKVADAFRVTRGEVLSKELVSDCASNATPYPVYSSQTKNGGLFGYYNDYLYEDAITWTTDGANAGDVKFRKGKFFCTNVCGVLLSNTGYANLFVAELLGSVAKKHVSYIGNPKLMNGVMGDIRIPLPSLHEQQKIADCLTSLDDLIRAEEEAVEALRAHKTGLMQQLFPRAGETTPRLRFPEFRDAGPWEVQRLGEIADVLQGYGFPEKFQGKTTSEYPFYKVSDISNALASGTHFIEEAANYVDDDDLSRLRAKTVPSGTTIFAKIGEAIRSNRRVVTTKECVVDNNTAGIKAKDEKATDLFVFYLFSMVSLIEYSGGVVPSVSKAAIENIKVCCPMLPEQQKIADCLTSLDDLIRAREARLGDLRAHKTGLMQQLFPQEVR
jgi:type I restriction enzyme S subunit